MQEFEQVKSVQGKLTFAGDKSISHRALIFSSLSSEKSILHNLSNGEDVKSTMVCLQQMGCKITESQGVVEVQPTNIMLPEKIKIYAGNSGTTSRLLCGLLIHKKYGSIISGDESLSSRPMKRVIEPLTQMGGILKTSERGTLPLEIFPSNDLHPINYKMEVPSAQVKSAVLLSGIMMDGITSVTENEITRDHTERMLALRTESSGKNKTIYISKKDIPHSGEYFIPGDISSAAFFTVLALLTKRSELMISNVSFNPTRTPYFDLLKKMGADIEFVSEKISFNEPYGDVVVRSSALKNIDIPAEVIPQIIDEIPILSIAGIFSEGNFTVRNAKELRIKESDRIKAMCHNFRIMGLVTEEYEDGFSVSGTPGKGPFVFESFNDHRIAMSCAIVCSLLPKGGKVNMFESVGISNPEFLKQIKIISKNYG